MFGSKLRLLKGILQLSNPSFLAKNLDFPKDGVINMLATAKFFETFLVIKIFPSLRYLKIEKERNIGPLK